MKAKKRLKRLIRLHHLAESERYWEKIRKNTLEARLWQESTGRHRCRCHCSKNNDIGSGGDWDAFGGDY